MGYETDFKITAEPALTEDLVDDIMETSGYRSIEYDGSEAWLYGAKWYDYREDMLAVSSRHPDVLFKVEGEGEEQPDLWHHYFRNGKSVRYEAEITYPELDEGDMK